MVRYAFLIRLAVLLYSPGFVPRTCVRPGQGGVQVRTLHVPKFCDHSGALEAPPRTSIAEHIGRSLPQYRRSCCTHCARDEAKDSGQIAAAISAEVSRGKVAGLYIDRKEVMVSKMESMSSEDLISRIKHIVDGSNIKTINQTVNHENGKGIIQSTKDEPVKSSLAKN